jgi:plasmid stabilization system protein ParE
LTRKLEFRPEAFADIAEAFSWYEGQRPGLGSDFERAIERTTQLLTERPEAGPVVRGPLRRALVYRFPFAVYYTLTESVLEIRGVLHTSRDPSTWQHRA